MLRGFANAPADVAEDPVQEIVGEGPIAGVVMLVVDDEKPPTCRLGAAGKPVFDEAEAKVEPRFVGLRAAARERVVVRHFRRPDIVEVKRAIRPEDFGMAKLDRGAADCALSIGTNPPGFGPDRR